MYYPSQPQLPRSSRREFLRTAAVGLTVTAGLGACRSARRRYVVGKPSLTVEQRLASNFSISIETRTPVTQGPTHHRAFPGLTRLKDGTLLVLYREGSDHWRTDDAVAKVTRSSDDGATWSEPETIHQEEGWGCSSHHGPKQLADGSVMAPAVAIRHVENGQRGPFEFRVFNLRSHDNGRTWQRKEIGPQPGWVWQNQYGRIKEIDGMLFQGGGGAKKGDDFWRTGYFVSHDNGETWPEWRTIATHLQDENDLLELADGRLLSMIRSGKEPSSRATYRSYSNDHGKTWSPAEKLDLFGQCPSLLMLPSGHILFGYRQVRPTVHVGIGLAVSPDDGQTWREVEPLYVSPTDSVDCAYPSMIVDGGHHVLAAYYTTFVDGNSHIELARLRVDVGA